MHFVCVLSGCSISTTVIVSIQSEKDVVKTIDAKSTSRSTCFDSAGVMYSIFLFLGLWDICS